MSTIYKLAGLSAEDYITNISADQGLVYSATKDYLMIAESEALSINGFFVQSLPTTDFQETVKLPMTGMTPLRSEENNADSVAQKGDYEVQYPLYNYGDEINRSVEDAAYDTPANFQMHIDGVIGRAANRRRFDAMKRIFNKANFSVEDKRRGTLTIKPLANQDGTLYPPLQNATEEAQANHYIGSNYIASAITDTNNPIKTLVDLLALTWGDETGGIPVGVIMARDDAPYVQALTDFIPVIPHSVSVGDDTDTVNLFASMPGQTIGTINGALINIYDRVPTGYMSARHMGVEAPLIERHHPAGTLVNGLSLSSGPNFVDFPMLYNSWDLRFGLGTRNRLSAACLQLVASTTYTTPTIYA